MPADVYVALVHHPVLNKEGRIVTTSVTNLDLHDISRNARTYGVKGFFVVTPSEAQQGMVSYIRDYWHEGFGASYNPDRKEAIGVLKLCATIEESCLTIEELSGNKPLLVATTAKRLDNSMSYGQMRQKMASDQPVLLAFGTGYGLAPEFMQSVDVVLEPIETSSGYNHLPVRSAVAIILDRLLGERYECN